MMRQALVLAGALPLALGVALPQPSEMQPRGAGNIFSISESQSQPALPGPLAMQKTYYKYKKQSAIPADVAAAAAAIQSGTVVATPQPYDEEYLAPVSIGGKTFNLDFDTGSSDLWVLSSSLSTSQKQGHNVYQNTGVRESGETWQIQYGDGSGAQGVVYADKVVIGGVTATSQAVEAATSISSTFASGPEDGLLGLALQSINTCTPKQCPTFMTTVGPSLASNLFTATLKKGKPGSYDFGYIDSSKYTGTLSYQAINTANGFWEVNASGYAVGTGSKVSSTIDLIADTGTTLIYLPTNVVKAYYAKVSGASYSSAQGAWIFPCTATLPNFSVYIGGAAHTVPGSYLSYQPLGDGTCYGAMQYNTGIGISILGDSFLKSQFVVFDLGNSRLGLAQQA